MSASTRHQIIKRLRHLLLRFDEFESSLCRVMAREGLFCRGFGAWTEAELRERFAWFCEVRQGVEREELEHLADRWQQADQSARGLMVPCDLGDAAPPERIGCRGWRDFDDATLEAFAAELEAALADRDPGGRN